MSRDPRLYLEDILTACRRIRGYTAGMTLETFTKDDKTQDAVVRNLEIIGEAAKQLPDAVTNAMPNVPWREVRGFRDILAHKYFGVDYSIVWDAIATELPSLEAAVVEYLRS